MSTSVRNRARRVLAAYRRLKTDTFFKFPYPTVNLYSWRPKSGGVNFGDELGRVITTLMLARRGMTLEDEARAPRQLLTIGSVMHFAREGAVIWGTGVHGSTRTDVYEFADLDVRSCRGPRTREWLLNRGIAAPEVYGDPALLLPILAEGRFQADRRSKTIGFVPNLFDAFDREAVPKGVQIIDPMQSWNRCVEQILGCGFIVSSSLHGIILAEAFGIKAQMVDITGETTNLKYFDYYQGTGRQTFSVAHSLADALASTGETLPVFDSEALMRAFPYDLWL